MRSFRRLLLGLALLSSPFICSIQSAWATSIGAGAARQHGADVAVDTGPLLAGSRRLVTLLGGVAVLLSISLCLVPARAVAITKRRVERIMMERTFTIQEEDRRRIARELHDGAGQALTAARLQLMELQEVVRDTAAADPIVARIIGSIDEAIDEVRRSTSALAPPTLAELGLAGALDRHCEAFAQWSGLAVRCDVLGQLPPLNAQVEIACYRIAQEALHNASRHAGAKRAWVHLDAAGNALRLDVGDDGAGFDDQARRGFGLDSIRERVRLAGGTLRLLDGSGPGVRIGVTIPLA